MVYIPNKGWKHLGEIVGSERLFAMMVNAMDKERRLNAMEMENLLETQHYGKKENVDANDLEWYKAALKKAGAEEVKEKLAYVLKTKGAGELVEPVMPPQFNVFYKGKIDRKQLLELIAN